MTIHVPKFINLINTPKCISHKVKQRIRERTYSCEFSDWLVCDLVGFAHVDWGLLLELLLLLYDGPDHVRVLKGLVLTLHIRCSLRGGVCLFLLDNFRNLFLVSLWLLLHHFFSSILYVVLLAYLLVLFCSFVQLNYEEPISLFFFFSKHRLSPFSLNNQIFY